MDWFTYALAVLAVYRLAYMLAYEDGPADIFARLRERAGQATWVGRGLHCVLCISFWLSLIAALFIANHPAVWLWFWFAIAGGVLVLHKVLYREE